MRGCENSIIIHKGGRNAPIFKPNKKVIPMLIFTILSVVCLYFVVSVAYAIKLDNILYYKYPTMEKKEFKKLVIYCFFWIIFFVKLDKIIKGKE